MRTMRCSPEAMKSPREDLVMKRGKIHVLTLLLTALSLAAWAAPVGTVQSSGSFLIHRGENPAIERQNGTLVVQTGDLVISKGEILTLRTTNGASLAIGRDARISLVDAQTLELKQGQAALSATSASGVALRIEELLIRPLPTEAVEDEVQPGFFAVSHSHTGQIVVHAVQRNLEICSMIDEAPVALMAAGDTLRLTRDGEVWQVASERVGQATGEGSQLSDDTKVTEDDDEDKVLFGFLRLTPAVVGGAAVAGGAAVVVAGTVYYNESQDDDKKDDDDEETSPMSNSEDDDWYWEGE